MSMYLLVGSKIEINQLSTSYTKPNCRAFKALLIKQLINFITSKLSLDIAARHNCCVIMVRVIFFQKKVANFHL